MRMRGVCELRGLGCCILIPPGPGTGFKLHHTTLRVHWNVHEKAKGKPQKSEAGMGGLLGLLGGVNEHYGSAPTMKKEP